MKLSLLSCLVVILYSCNTTAPASPKKNCTDPCLKDTIKYVIQHPGNPYVYISAKACSPDTILWSTKYSTTNRKMGLIELLGRSVNINTEFVSCFIKDTSFALIQLNDCSTFRGYALKLPFNKKNSIRKFSSALTSFDKKFKVEEGLICYADYSFLYVEDILTGNKEQLKLADKQLNIDWENIHATFDSVNISHNRIFVTLLENKEAKSMEKTISL